MRRSRSTRWADHRPAPAPSSPATREQGPAPEVRAFEQGPWGGLPVPPFPEHAMRIVERLTGRAFDPALFVAYERARAYAGYEVALPELAISEARLGAAPAAVEASPTSSPPSQATAAPGYDPHDLGD